MIQKKKQHNLCFNVFFIYTFVVFADHSWTCPVAFLIIIATFLESSGTPHSHHDVFNMDSITDFLVVANQSHWVTTLTLVIMRAGGVVHERAVQFQFLWARHSWSASGKSNDNHNHAKKQ